MEGKEGNSLESPLLRVWSYEEVRSGQWPVLLSGPKKRGDARAHCPGSQGQFSSLVCSARTAIPALGPGRHQDYQWAGWWLSMLVQKTPLARGQSLRQQMPELGGSRRAKRLRPAHPPPVAGAAEPPLLGLPSASSDISSVTVSVPGDTRARST